MEVRNTIRMCILSDGTVTVKTDAFDEEVHEQAEQLIKETFELLGGERQVVERHGPGHHHHTHLSGHQHAGH